MTQKNNVNASFARNHTATSQSQPPDITFHSSAARYSPVNHASQIENEKSKIQNPATDSSDRIRANSTKFD